jgi:hypothetical protein
MVTTPIRALERISKPASRPSSAGFEMAHDRAVLRLEHAEVALSIGVGRP